MGMARADRDGVEEAREFLRKFRVVEDRSRRVLRKRLFKVYEEDAASRKAVPVSSAVFSGAINAEFSGSQGAIRRSGVRYQVVCVLPKDESALNGGGVRARAQGEPKAGSSHWKAEQNRAAAFLRIMVSRRPRSAPTGPPCAGRCGPQ